MKTIIGEQQLRQEIWNFLQEEGANKHEKPMIVWCDCGTDTYSIVSGETWTHTKREEYIEIARNEDDLCDIPNFIGVSYQRLKKGHRLICVTVTPFDDEETIINSFDDDYECIRYKVSAEDWFQNVEMGFLCQDTIQDIVVKFISQYPDYLCIPHIIGPQNWSSISFKWGCLPCEEGWQNESPRAKLRQMMLSVFIEIGGHYEPLFTHLKKFLLLNRGYDNLTYFSPKNRVVDYIIRKEDHAPIGDNFTDIFK